VKEWKTGTGGSIKSVQHRQGDNPYKADAPVLIREGKGTLMCLAIPGKVVDIYEKDGLRMGRIDYSGVMHEACLEYVPEIDIGQYTIVHAGFAISILDEEEARKSFEAWDELIRTADEAGIPVPAPIPSPSEKPE
jgi:hydrogenase expression/formation protein HypC